mmetsp:Transcript_38885/g.88432  ORF Transcript_38885/g.88432 Transcript_38885/m.88432 type:complete len:245 (-) Transcript_38885:894-1628(-)
MSAGWLSRTPTEGHEELGLLDADGAEATIRALVAERACTHRGGHDHPHYGLLALLPRLDRPGWAHVAVVATAATLTSHRLPEPSTRAARASAMEHRPDACDAHADAHLQAWREVRRVVREALRDVRLTAWRPQLRPTCQVLLRALPASGGALVGGRRRSGLRLRRHQGLLLEDRAQGTDGLELCPCDHLGSGEAHAHDGPLGLLSGLDLALRAQVAMAALERVLATLALPEPRARPASAGAMQG